MTFVDIDINGVVDPDNDPLSVSIQCIFQDEELNANGDGNFIYDADGINTPTASLRSERSGNNNGRVYHIDFIATDGNGARCGGEVTVSVPHSIKNPAVDEGRLYQSVPSENICGLHDINNPPWIYSDPIVTGATYEVYLYDINGHDPDQDVLSYSIVNGPSGLIIDHESGLLTWDSPEAGIHSIIVRVEDGRGGSDQQAFELFINGPPEITSDPILLHQVGTPYRYQVEAVDPNNDALTYALITAPNGMSVGPATGLVSWDSPVPGEYPINVEVTDGRGGSDSQSWNVFINGPPVITSTPVTELVEGNPYSYRVIAVDPNGDTLSYTLNQGPDGLTIDQATGLISWVSPTPGEYTVAVHVADNHGGSDEQVYTLTIIPIPTVTLTAGATEIKSGETTTLTWTSTNAETLSIEPGIGMVEQSGITSVRPTETTTYTITASGRGGTATASVTITVTAPAIDLVPVSPGIDDASCPESVTLHVQLQNSGEGIADPNIAVTFYNGDPHNGGIAIGTARSLGALDPGASETVSVQWISPPVGDATIYIKADDIGNGQGQFEETNEENNIVSFDVSVCEELEDPDANSISGEVIDAVTGARLSNVVVDLHIAENGEPGAVIASFRTNYEGIFIFRGLEPGTYIITGTVAGYADGEREAILTRNAVLEHQDLVLSPVLQDEAIRIVLTWGQNPEDLEAHLTAPNPDGCRHHCFYWNKKIPGASLDLDDRHSFGPETITITDLTSGIHHYYVHNFTHRANLNNYYLAYYGAEVKVYRAGEQEPLIFKTPENRYTRGTVWHVFDIDGDTGEIIPVNKFTHQVEPGQIDFPRITSSPGNYPRAYWGTPYKYQITAEDPDDDVLTYTLLHGPKGMTIDPLTGLLEWTPLGIPDYQNLVSIKVSDGRCGEDTQSFYLYEYSTPVVTFSADPCSAYNANGDITLSWDTHYAKTILIDQGIGEVEASGSITIPSPEFPKVYKLTAFNDAASTTRQVPAAIPAPGLSAYPSSIEPTHTAELRWNCGCAATCEIDQGIGEVSGTGSIEVSPMETTTYTISASNAVGQKTRATTLSVGLPSPPAPPVPPVFPVPTISFSGDPSCYWSPGIPITLSWSTSNANRCEITPDIGQVDCNGSIVVNPEKAGTYTLVARGDGGVKSASFTYPPGKPVTYRRLTVTPTGYVKPGDEVTLNWSTACADLVTITGKGSDHVVDSVDVVGEVGSQLVTVLDDLPYTYTLTAANEWGENYYSITLNGFPPSGTFTTDDSVIKVGESAVLHWTSTNADTCTIAPDIGDVDCDGGSVTVTPKKPSWYNLYLKGPGGTRSYGLYINFVPPDVDIQATPETINRGESTTLSWVFSNATSCTIDNGIGEIKLGETLDVTPLVTTMYRIYAVGPGGTSADQVTVNVISANPQPTVDITVNPAVIWNGETSTLTWNSQYAESVTITPDIGTVSSSGSMAITPTKDTIYTITAIGHGGIAKANVRITVLQYTPTAELTATPENIELGGKSLLSWTTEHADTVTISPLIGKVEASGSIEVSPEATTTYQITAKGPGGTAVDLTTVSYPVPTVTLTAEPATVNYPGTSTLSWASTSATSVTITPDIGTVEPSGTLEVSPLSNTTYTITATGPGGTATKAVTVTVIYPEPTASLSAEPSSITKGESVQLTWSSENADTCSITPFIGTVECSGTQTLTPDTSTTYTFTAMGPGGSVSKTASVTVIHPVPTLAISADPATIEPGGSAFLNWTTTDTDYVTIDQGIGTQPANGRVSVSPDVTTTYTVTAVGLGGTVSDTVTVTVAEPSPITLSITSHATGDIIHRPDVMVIGTVSHADGLETGVMVNGVTALVYGGVFVANDVPVAEGEDIIYAFATDSAGNTTDKSITVTLEPQPKRLDLRSVPKSGLVPFETEIISDSNFELAEPVSVSYMGPGELESFEVTGDDVLTAKASVPGIYYFTGTAEDEAGTVYDDMVAILAVDRAALDALLQAKWSGMKDAMIAGDIEGAVSYFAYDQQETFRQIYTLVADKLAQIATDMQPIEMIYQKNDVAEYRLRKDIIFKGEPLSATFYVYFQKEPDGIWRIWDY